MHKLRRNAVSPREYFAEASRVVRLKTALASGSGEINPNVVDAETAADTFKLDTDSRDQLRRLFEQSDEWQYSGAHNGPDTISPENRSEVLELIENLKCKAAPLWLRSFFVRCRLLRCWRNPTPTSQRQIRSLPKVILR